MFCLRGWIVLLILLTNAAPIYITLFLLGTYILQRPCVYCSILLTVLVFSLFDFQADWFEPRWQYDTLKISETASSIISGNATVAEVLSETASLAITALNGSVANTAVEGLKRRIAGGQTGGTSTAVAAGSSAFEWLRTLAEKKQFRIPCIDVNVRL